MRSSSVPSTPAIGSEEKNGPRTVGSRQAETSSSPRARAVARSCRESPEPSTMRTPASGTSRASSSRRMTMQPALVVPAPRNRRAQVLDEHLRVEVVADLVHPADDRRHRPGADGRERGRARRRGARTALPPTVDAGRDERLPEGLRGPQGRVVDRVPVHPGPVDDERGERRRLVLVVGRAPAVRRAAPVEVPLVAEDPAGDAADAGQSERATRACAGRALQRRVAVALQNEPASPGGARSRPVAEHLGADPVARARAGRARSSATPSFSLDAGRSERSRCRP